MSIVYRKSLKGIDEVAFKSTGLPMRMASYLLVVDGESSVDQLAARNPQLPSSSIVLQGLMEQGFLEVASTSANVVSMTPMRVGNGANVMASQPAPQPQPQPTYQSAPASMLVPGMNSFPELETIKGNMVRDVSSLLASDAGPVIAKIEACRTKDDLFATMMGIKKIVLIYLDRNAAITLVSNSPGMRVTRALVYNFADLFNKVGFGILALYAVRQVVRETKLREAMAQL